MKRADLTDVAGQATDGSFDGFNSVEEILVAKDSARPARWSRIL